MRDRSTRRGEAGLQAHRRLAQRCTGPNSIRRTVHRHTVSITRACARVRTRCAADRGISYGTLQQRVDNALGDESREVIEQSFVGHPGRQSRAAGDAGVHAAAGRRRSASARAVGVGDGRPALYGLSGQSAQPDRLVRRQRLPVVDMRQRAEPAKRHRWQRDYRVHLCDEPWSRLLDDQRTQPHVRRIHQHQCLGQSATQPKRCTSPARR